MSSVTSGCWEHLSENRGIWLGFQALAGPSLGPGLSLGPPPWPGLSGTSGAQHWLVDEAHSSSFEPSTIKLRPTSRRRNFRKSLSSRPPWERRRHVIMNVDDFGWVRTVATALPHIGWARTSCQPEQGKWWETYRWGEINAKFWFIEDRWWVWTTEPVLPLHLITQRNVVIQRVHLHHHDVGISLQLTHNHDVTVPVS